MPIFERGEITVKRLFGTLAAMLLMAACIFVATVCWSMTHVEVYETPSGVVLELCGNSWLHNAETVESASK